MCGKEENVGHRRVRRGGKVTGETISRLEVREIKSDSSCSP
jgi:hypothetical protein